MSFGHQLLLFFAYFPIFFPFCPSFVQFSFFLPLCLSLFHSFRSSVNTAVILKLKLRMTENETAVSYYLLIIFSNSKLHATHKIMK